MSKITCKLISNSAYQILTQQLYTGFFILHKKGLINVTQSISKNPKIDTKKSLHLQKAHQFRFHVILNNDLKLCYDAHDSWEVDEKTLSEVDFYFKRSFHPTNLKSLGKAHKKVFPLGLHYILYPDTLDKFDLKRSLAASNKNIKAKLCLLARSLNVFNSFLFAPRLKSMESLPNYDLPPKILFMANAWDPYNNPPNQTKEKIKQRIQVNTTRAECIRLLRNEFGDNFYGGFVHSKFAVNNYKSLLMPDKTKSSKKNYLELLKSYPIGVATTGLHGSIGAKLSEYIALSKAPLSEKLNYEVTGNFEKGKNYLEFSSPQNCVEKAKQLFTDSKLRNSLMLNNSKYYQSYLKPDVLILNTLRTALQKNK